MTIPVKKISTFCKTGSGGTPSRSNNAFFENGTIPWVKSGELKNRYITEVEEYITDLAVEKSSAKLVSKGSLLIAMYGATVGEVSQLTFDATTNQAICNIQPDENVCDVNYLYRFLEASKSYLLSRRVGGGQPNISQSVIKDLDVPLPPLAEQRRIASILDQADELRQKRQQAIEKLDQLLQATFIEMFGDPVSNPKGWDLKPVGEISESKLGKMLDKKKQSSENDQYKYLRNANVQWFRFDLSDVFEMEFNEKDRKNCELKFGDILVCEGGEPGRAAIWKNDLENCFFQKALHRVRLDMTQILPEYFVWLFWFYSKNGGFDDHITVATIAHLTGVKMKAMQVPIPPLSMQEEFQQKVNEIEVLKTTLENSSKLFESLFSSLQNQAFKGTL